MAFNLSSSLKKSLTSTVNTVRTTVGTVSQDISSAANNFTNNISSVTGLSSRQVSSALLGGAVGGVLNGGRGAAIGALGGGILGGSGVNNLIGQVQNKLDGLISNAEAMQGLLNNPLKLIERGRADLIGVTGEENSLIQSQYLELTERSQYTDFVDNGYLSPYQGDDTSASRIPNPLRNHNGVNYVITLGILDAAEYNNPEAYRSAGGFKNYVIQSSGGNLDKRYQVFDETGSGSSEHAEYYIDDIEMDAVVAPNANTRVTLGTSLTFTVTEPYSMGNFIQAVIGSAKEAGHASYTQAPFCLKIDFKGWNLDGTTDANFIGRPMFIPIKLINMEFNVTGKGSTYVVKAVPMSESGLADNINKTKTSIRSTGFRCHEVLETNDTSVTSGINSQIAALEEADALAPYDRYIIAFPKNRDTLLSALQAGTVTETAFTTSSEEREEQRLAAGIENPQLRSAFNPTVITINSPSQTYAILKTFAEDIGLMNEIGLSTLNEDTNAPGNSSEADASQVINPETRLVDTQSLAAQPADKARDFQFNQNEQITSIIEKIVMQTTYAAERSTEGAKNGLNKWFRIDTQVFLDESPLTEVLMGRRPKVYVYSVVPYEVPEAVTIGPQQRPSNSQGLNRLAIKEYNYIYTGKNEDVLNFDINFNNAFMLTALADFGNNAGSNRDLDAGKTALTQTTGDSGAKPTTSTEGIESATEIGGSMGMETHSTESSGTYSNDVRRKIAEMFHDRITNMTVDMVTAEMEIMGDPYFIPQETGNYVAQLGEKPSITQDGTMPYSTGPVLVDINFKTPFDYQVSGATMEFPQVVPGFSGTFQVWGVVNRFSKGRFTQTLKMFRHRGQDDKATTNNSNFMEIDNSVANVPRTVQSDGTVGQPSTPNLEEVGQGVDLGIANVLDLTKVIPQISNISGQLNSTLGELETQARAAASQSQSALNTAANRGITAATDAARSRVRRLLG